MQWRMELAFHRAMREMQAGGDKALHVSAAATIEISAARSELERITAPLLPLNRNHVSVSGKGDALRI